MKSATTLRTQQAIARYGKAARHPLCLAALHLWRLDVELFRWTKEIASIEEVLNSAKQMKEKAQDSALLRRINKQLLRALEHYRGVKIARSILPGIASGACCAICTRT